MMPGPLAPTTRDTSGLMQRGAAALDPAPCAAVHLLHIILPVECSDPSMPEPVLAATTLGAFRTEVREYPFPEITPDAGILRIEAAGVCGSDWQAYQQDRPPRIMGHENVGRI